METSRNTKGLWSPGRNRWCGQKDVYQAQVLSLDDDTDFFEILAGVLQGDTLAPYLFTIALDYVMRQAVGNESNLGFTLDRSRSRQHPAKVICDTDFADDIALLSNTTEQAQLLLYQVENLQSRLDSI